MAKPSQGTIISLNTTLMENYKTLKQAELEINPPKEKCKDNCKCTPLKKASLLSQVRELVNTTSNDMLLGEAVRKLFL